VYLLSACLSEAPTRRRLTHSSLTCILDVCLLFAFTQVLAGDGSIDKPFCVIIAGQFGLAMLNAFGAGEDRMVLMDATGGTNKYGYQLYVLLVVDDYREGVPVAFMVTSSQEATEINIMLEVSNAHAVTDLRI
jgi:MULE transposase domain